MADYSPNAQSSCFENPGGAQELYSTDDESTGQRCSAVREKQLQVEVNLEKIISKHKSDSMFELRKLSLQQRPVSEFASKHTLEEHLRKQMQPHQASINTTENVESTEEQQKGDSSAKQEGSNAENSDAEFAEEQQQESGSAESHSSEPQPEEQLETSPEGAREAPTPQWEQIQSDMQALQELRVVNGILQGPVHVQIDRSLRDVMEQHQAGRRRPRPRHRPRPVQAEESEDEMQAPVGRLLAPGEQSRRQRGARGRRVRFRSQVPTPNSDGRYSIPRRDQSIIVERLRQSPALNSLGEEARDEIVAEVGSLVSQQLVTSALSGDFRGVLELHIQSRAEELSRGGVPNPMRQPRVHRHQGPQYFEDQREAIPSAGTRELREEMVIMKGQLNELKQMMRVSFDLQLDIQRAIRQEVSAALTAFLTSTQSGQAAATGGAAVCPIPTPEQGKYFPRVQVAESGHCVICSEGTIDSVIYHCGHMCTCMACGLEMKSKALKCPICRAPIVDVIRAYASML